MQIPVTDLGSWPNYSACDANAGHGHIYRRPDGVVVRCGGARYCVACTADELESASAWCGAVAAGEGWAEGPGRHPTPRAEDPRRCPVCAAVRWAEVASASDRYGRRVVIRLLTEAAPLEAGHVGTNSYQRAVRWVAARRPFFRSTARNGLLSDAALSESSVHAIVRRRALRAGIDPAVIARLGAHSLRTGHVTQTLRNGASFEEVMAQTGHNTVSTVLRYRRENAPLVANSVTKLGL
ncbi:MULTISPECIES: tyrosine-type recombinase/integrase [Tsukamurella]|nr:MULTISPECIES: tyrosine-type recombinase/integrase [Tsukamurella]